MEPLAHEPPNDDNLLILERVEGELAGVDRALQRLDDGTYGICEVCGERIDDAVLSESPTSRWCRAHLAAG